MNALPLILTPWPTAQPFQIPRFGPSSLTCLLLVLSPSMSPTQRAFLPKIHLVSQTFPLLPQCRAISTSWKCLYVVNPLGSPHTYLSSKTIQGSSVQIQVSDWCMPAFSLEPPTQNRVTFVKPIKITLGKFLFCFLKQALTL